MPATITPPDLGNLPMTDAEILRFAAALRGSGWGFPTANPAADAFAVLYCMVMDADPDDMPALADDVAGHAHAYAQRQLEDAA